jgi:hypothetical protein
MRRRCVGVTRLAFVWRSLGEPTNLVYRNRIIGVFSPTATESDLDPITSGFRSPYRPEPTLELEVAKVAMEAAQALAEAEELREQLLPDRVRGRSAVRDRQHLRRRAYFAELRQQHQEGS